MGTRRMRDLSPRRDVSLGLYDERADRRAAAQAKFGVRPFATLGDALAWAPDALVISTPPGTKGPYIDLAFDRKLHHFSEADIWTYGAAGKAAQNPGLVSAPSDSMSFLPLIRGLAPLLRENVGRVLSYQFFMSTYMPSWHPTEGLEYYARHRNAAPAREMIPFELSYLDALFGPASEVAGRYEKFGELPGAIEDTWSLSMRLRDGGIGQLTITMACPAADYRRGCVFGTKGQLTWDVFTGSVTVQTAADKVPRQLEFGRIGAVLEAAYAGEISTFVDAVLGRKVWPNPYAASQQSCATLAAAELSSRTGRWVRVDPLADPEHFPPGSTATSVTVLPA